MSSSNSSKVKVTFEDAERGSVGSEAPLLNQKKPELKRSPSSLRGRAIEAHTLVDAGAYVAVLAAALGRVSLTVERRHGGKDGTGRGVKIHPFFMWLIAIPLFVVQISCVFSLRFDLNVIKPVDENKDNKSETLYHLTQTLKLLMVLILQITQFSEMAQTLRFLIFSLNPITWVEIAHPTKDEWLSKDSAAGWKIFFHPVFLVPWPILALLMRFIIGYLVCVDSVSLILSADRVTDAIFNSLALTFVIDLNKAWKLVCSIVFHLKLEDEPLWLNPWQQATEGGSEEVPDAAEDGRVWTDGSKILGSSVGFLLGALSGGQVCWKHYPGWWPFGALLCGLFCGSLSYLWIKVTCLDRKELNEWFGDDMWLSKLRRGIGAKTLEGIFAGLALAFIYMQQSMVILFAYKTNVLPVARDVCTQYRWLHNQAKYFQVVAVWFSWFEHIILVDAQKATMDVFEKELNNITHRQTPVNFINANGANLTVTQIQGCLPRDSHPYGDYYRMTVTDRWNLIQDHPLKMLAGAVVLLLLLLGSHTGSVLHSRFFHISEGEDTSTSAAKLRRSMTRLEELFDQQQAKINSLEAKIDDGAKHKEE